MVLAAPLALLLLVLLPGAASAVTCDPTLPRPTTSDPGTVTLADGFEEGFGQWTKVLQEGDASARIQSSVAKRGLCALELVVTTNSWDSRANLQKVMPARTNEIWADGWFDERAEGVSGWNTPTFRIFSGGKRVFDVSRQNIDGNFYVRWPNPAGGWSFGSTGRKLDLNRWYHVKIHVVARGNLSTAEVWLDGTRVYASNAVTLGITEFDTVLAGAEHQSQKGDTVADDIVIKTLQAAPTPEVFSDGFESANFAAWTATQTGGDGSATVQSSVRSAGTYAAKLSATANSGSLANVSKTLAAAQTDLTTSADVDVQSEGAAGGATPLLGVNDAGGARLVSVVRNNQSGDRISVTYGGTTYATSGTLPLGTFKTLALRTITWGAGAGTVVLTLNGTEVYRSTTASIGSTGVKAIVLGSSAATGKAFSVVVDRASAVKGSSGPQDDPRYKLLVADYLNKRLVIMDFAGRVVWQMNNPSGSTEYSGGPIGVRWLPNNQILATFGSGEVGVIDVATKKWVWKTKGYNGDTFQSPYDAELLPDGRLAVALRFNDKGRISVYDRATGAEVWRHLLPNAHSVHFRTAAQSYNSDLPTLLIGGFGNIKEVTYNPGGSQAVTWVVKSEYTHDVMVVENDNLLTNEGYYVQKINRAGTRLWKKNTPDEDRRVAVNPNFGGGYIYTVGEGDRIEFRDVNGNLLRDFSKLSDNTVVDYPYGIQVIDYPG
jgi:hypothetical protein